MDKAHPESEDVIELAIAAMAVVTVFGIARCVGPADHAIASRIKALGPAETRSPARTGVAARLGTKLPGDRSSIAAAIQSANVDVSQEQIVAWRWIAAVVGVLVGLAMGPLAIIVAPVLGAFGYKVPSAYLRSKVSANKRAVASALPDAVELLAVCTQAGLNIPLALERVARATPGVLGDELGRVVDQVGLGATRRDALKGLVARCDLDDVHAFVSALDQADRFGAGVASSLDALAADMRSRRRTQTEEAARRAPVKMLFPLVLMILPAFILLTIVPLLLGTFQTLGF